MTSDNRTRESRSAEWLISDLVDDKRGATVQKMGNLGKFVRGRIDDVDGHDRLTNAARKRRRGTKFE